MHGGDIADIDVAGGADGRGHGGEGPGENAPDRFEGFVEAGGGSRGLNGGAGNDSGVE